MLINKVESNLIDIKDNPKIQNIDTSLLYTRNDKPFDNKCDYSSNRMYANFLRAYILLREPPLPSSNRCSEEVLYAICDVIDDKIRICGCCENHFLVLKEKGLLDNKKIYSTQQEVNSFIKMINIML